MGSDCCRASWSGAIERAAATGAAEGLRSSSIVERNQGMRASECHAGVSAISHRAAKPWSCATAVPSGSRGKQLSVAHGAWRLEEGVISAHIHR
jgi:hypothetical protein